jgi:uncharacterized protein (DUF305 family)
VTTTLPPRQDCNAADLRYLRRALRALRESHRASDRATTLARDPRVRTFARQTRGTQADDIRAVTSMLLQSARHKGGLVQASAGKPANLPATVARPGSPLEGLAVDRRFIEILTAHAEACLASAQTEMIEGHGEVCRRHAEDAIRTSWRQLAALSLLAPANLNAGYN